MDYVQFLHDGSEVLFQDGKSQAGNLITPAGKEGEVILEVPVVKPNLLVPVMEIFLKEE